MRQSLRILRTEHMALRGMARVLRMDGLVLERGGAVDSAILRDIVDYLREFPMRFHHPKEEQALFAVLRGRSDTMDRLLDMLCAEHAAEAEMVTKLERAIEAHAAGDNAPLVSIAQIYGRFLEHHIHTEEAELFPQAVHLLSEAAWTDIDAEMAQVSREESEATSLDRFTRLQMRIMDAALPPMGAGGAAD